MQEVTSVGRRAKRTFPSFHWCTLFISLFTCISFQALYLSFFVRDIVFGMAWRVLVWVVVNESAEPTCLFITACPLLFVPCPS